MEKITLKSHTSSVLVVAFDHSGLLASGSNDLTIKIWNAETGELLKTLRSHTRAVNSVTFNQNGMLASGSNDFTVKLWDVTTGELLKTLNGIYLLIYSLNHIKINFYKS